MNDQAVIDTFLVLALVLLLVAFLYGWHLIDRWRRHRAWRLAEEDTRRYMQQQFQDEVARYGDPTAYRELERPNLFARTRYRITVAGVRQYDVFADNMTDALERWLVAKGYHDLAHAAADLNCKPEQITAQRHPELS